MLESPESEQTVKPVSVDQLKAMLDAEINDGLGYLGSELSGDRAKALDYYYGRKKGVFKAEKGRSSVVTRDVQETVEWATAQIVRMFTGEEYCVFEPQNADDVPQAKQETDYVNYVIQRQNDGFNLFHDWIKDGLLSRTGVAHVQWDDTPKTCLELYEGLTQPQLEMLLSEPGNTLVEMDQRSVQVEQMTEQGPQLVELPVFDCRIRHDRQQGKVKVQIIPPEEFLIDRRARCIEDAQFVAHRYLVTVSELRQMGVPESIIDEIAGYSDEQQYDMERYARDVTEDAYDYEADGIDETSRRTWVYDCYVRVDFDGDGYDELRRIMYCGHEILENEPVEEIPYATFCPVPMPHRFHGQSYADLVMDLQEIRTALMRGSLDNLYLTNMPMKEVVDGQVNLKDLLSPRPGGVVRSKQQGMVRELTTTPMMQPSMQMMEFVDGMRESRTGLTRYNQGLDADSLNKTAAGMNMILNQSQLRVELIARIFAEGGVKRLFRLVHGLLRRHQNIPQTVKLTGGWVDVNPTDWRERTDMSVSVGLGNGTRDQQLAGLQQLMAMQMQAMQIGITDANQLYNSHSKLAKLLGYKDADNYFHPPPPPPDPQQQAQAQQQQIQMQAQATAMIEQAKEQAKSQARIAESQAKYQLDLQKAAQQHQMKMAEIAAQEAHDGQELSLEREKAQQDYSIKVAELRQDHEHFIAKQAQDLTVAREKMSVDAIKYSKDAQVEREAVDNLND